LVSLVGYDPTMISQDGQSAGSPDEVEAAAIARVSTKEELAALLRQLRRRHARLTAGSELSYRHIAAKTGWSHGAVGHYLSGHILPPVGRFDVLVQLLGANPAELRRLASARDRVEDGVRSAPEKPIGRHIGAPRQLPADVASFTGRADELAHLDRLHRADRKVPAASVIVVSGMAGVGKTTLAVHWAHLVAQDFPDGQLYANLRGFDGTAPTIELGQTLCGFLYSLGVPAAQVPPDDDAQIALYRSRMADRRMLIVLDNAASVEQVRALVPGAARCLVLVTSRHQLTGLAVTHNVSWLGLDVLSRSEAREMLAGRLGAGRIAAESTAVDALVDACGQLPLALAVTAARAATSQVRTIRQLADELSAGRTRLNALRSGDASTDVRSVFSWSYQRLTPAAARLFRLLGSHPGYSITAAAAASLAALPPADVQPLLADLVEAHLTTEPTAGRYGMHDLMRVYAAEAAPADPGEAVARVLDHYVHSALHASALLDQHQLHLTPDQPLAGVAPESFDDRDQAERWFSAEYETLLAGFGHAVEHGLDPQVWLLAAGLSTFVDWSGRWQDWVRLTTAGLAAAQRIGGAREQAHMYRRRGMAHHRLGRPTAAYQDLESARRLCETYRDGRELCRIHVNLGIVRGGQGRMPEAFAHAQEAYRYAVEADTGTASRANILNGMAWCLIQLGEPHQAEEHCRHALSLFAEANDGYGEAEAWDTYGLVHQRLGHHARAVDSYRQALALFRDVRAQLPKADTLHRLGDAHHALGQSTRARDAWQAALVILDELDHPDTARIRSKIDELPSTAWPQRA